MQAGKAGEDESHRSLVCVTVPESPIRADNRRADSPSVSIEEVRFKVAEGEEIRDGAQEPIDPLNDMDSCELEQEPVRDREYHNGGNEDQPPEAQLFNDACPQADAEPPEQNFVRVWNLVIFSEQIAKIHSEAEQVYRPRVLCGFPDRSLNHPELKESEWNQAWPEEHQPADHNQTE